MKMATTYKVQTQLISIYKADGTRINYSRKTGWRDFKRYKSLATNVRNAINYVTLVRNNPTQELRGGIVVIRTIVDGHSLPIPTKIFEAKMGTDGKPFTRFVGVAGNYWKRQLGIK